ncbi:MAG TPA: lytic murein transglycosylase [Solirubrobacteraceae bacterium]
MPTPANPTFSFALPGAAPIGVPNFFIDSFRIPPFLLPIYQAAGTQYEVPWQILAAINEIETDYGRNLSVSSAGAVGWMQFLPSTWQAYAVDATGSGVADPYNPVDAIFTAAKYLHAAGASKNLTRAIFAYNHADWYVQSVLLRAKLIGGIPPRLIGALAGLVEGHFPVAARTKYADHAVQALATRRVTGANAAIPIESDPNSSGVALFAKKDSPVIAVNDGKVVAIGKSQKLGTYLELQDSTGNVYTYAELGSIPKLYPVPKAVNVTASEIAKQLAVPSAPVPKQAASAGTQPTPQTPTAAKAKAESKAASGTLPVTNATGTQPTSIPAPLVKERLFADPHRPASYAAGGELQVQSTAPQIASFNDYFSSVLHLAKNQYTLKPLKVGSVVVAGTILGRIGDGTTTTASHLWFTIRPAGKNAPYIDPKPILDGWKLLEATAVYRARRVDPFFGPGAKNPTIGQILLMSKQQLSDRVLQDPHVRIYTCGRRDIQAGLIDRRVLAAIEFLSVSALHPTVSGLECGHSLTGSTGVDAAGASGASVDISAINRVSILGHQGAGSIADMTIRRLLTLQGAMSPDEIVSLMSYKGQPNTLSLPDHANRIQVAYTPLFGQNKRLSAEITSILRPAQWIQLISRLNQIPEPLVPISPSKYAIKVR